MSPMFRSLCLMLGFSVFMSLWANTCAQTEAELRRALTQQPPDRAAASSLLVRLLADSRGLDAKATSSLLGRVSKLYAERGMMDEWQEGLDLALSSQPENGLLFRIRGEAALSHKRLAKARAALKRSIKLDPKDDLARQYLMQSYVIDFRSDDSLAAAKGVPGVYADWVNKEQRRLQHDLESHPPKQWMMIAIGSLLCALSTLVLSKRLSKM